MSNCSTYINRSEKKLAVLCVADVTRRSRKKKTEQRIINDRYIVYNGEEEIVAGAVGQMIGNGIYNVTVLIFKL